MKIIMTFVLLLGSLESFAGPSLRAPGGTPVTTYGTSTMTTYTNPRLPSQIGVGFVTISGTPAETMYNALPVKVGYTTVRSGVDYTCFQTTVALPCPPPPCIMTPKGVEQCTPVTCTPQTTVEYSCNMTLDLGTGTVQSLTTPIPE